MSNTRDTSKVVTKNQAEHSIALNKSLHEIELQVWSQLAADYDAVFASISTQAVPDILDSLGELTGKKHLDVACGTGHLVAAASQRRATSEGIDFAEPMVEIARVSYPNNVFRTAEATQLPYENFSFDAVTCAFGLSHIENSQAAVDEAYRVLKPGGYFAFTLWFDAENGNELFQIVNDAIARFGTVSLTLPESWTRLRFANVQACEAITRRSGFSSPIFKKLQIVQEVITAPRIVALFEKISVRSKMILDSQPRSVQQQIQEYILSKVEALRRNGIIRLAWPALLTVVQKPVTAGDSHVNP
jgi:ubiquinone/menaquinone biosynthesis C-methylase UbiE